MDSARPTAEGIRIETGTVIANYVVEDFVGQGTEGCVYVARDSLLGRQVALKTLRAGEAGETRGVEEARLLAGLEHPNIVRVYHARRHQGVWFVVYEYLAGGSLQAQLQRLGPLPLRRALEIGAQAASGLAYAHEASILHRDIKPQNMLLSKTGEIKLADFGLALDVRGGRKAPAQPVGTPAFLAPELWSGGSATTASDVFSLGTCLYCVLTGRLPFVANDSEQLRRAQLELTPKLPAGLPARVRELVLAMMAKAPESRPSSQSLAESLRALSNERYRSSASEQRSPSLEVQSPFTTGSAEEALRQTLRTGRDSVYLREFLSALRACPRGIALIGPTTADALLLFEVAREHAFERYELVARLALPKAQTVLLEAIEHKLTLPGSSSLRTACEQLLEPARDFPARALLELSVSRAVSGEQRREIEVLLDVAGSLGVLCVLVGASGTVPDFDGFRRIEAVSASEAADNEARLGLWLELATGGNYTFSRDGLRLCGAVCREEGRFWPRLAEDSLLIAAAAGLRVVTSWAVLGACAQSGPCHSVEDVAATWRRRPLTWPTPEVMARLTRLRETGEAGLSRARSTPAPSPSRSTNTTELVAISRSVSSNT